MMQHKIILSDKFDQVRADLAFGRTLAKRRLSVSMLSMATANQPGEKAWFVLQTFANREKAVEKMLRDEGVHAFLPLIAGGKAVRRGRVVQCADRVAIPGYVLVSIVPSVAAFAGLRRVKNVESIVGGADHPHRVSDEDMNRFKLVLGEWDDVKAHAETFAVGDWVRFDEGPFIGFSGHVRKLRKMSLMRGLKPVAVEAVVELSIGDQVHTITAPLALLVKM